MRFKDVDEHVKRILNGEVLVIDDPAIVRMIARAMGRQKRGRVHIGRDPYHRKTKITLL